jgi:hypothetical protein
VHHRRALIAGQVVFLAISALAAIAWLGAAIAGDPVIVSAARDAGPIGPIATSVAAGKHVRIDGPRGPIHVWIPASYHADTGATIIYVHGYFDDADTAWTGHQLPEQFALSSLNAMFVVPEAPVAQKTPINYPDLGELLRLVEEHTGAVRGAALTAVIGHSGAFRTIQAWLDEPLVDEIVMVDAMYGEENLILTWYRGSTRRRLITVGEDTLLGTESFASKIPETVTIDRFPPTYDTWPAEARTARHLYIRAQYEHMPLVRDGIVLPSLLRLLPVELLADLPWQLPLGSLPPLPDASIDAPTD